ncbi:MAG: MerR family transcriptional regulator [Candidatus Shapirobacteria bacterium]
MQNFITAGELAKLCGTSKRTILWYDKMGIIQPKKVTDNQYRYYDEEQVLEYQRIHLLTTLGVKLGEIKEKNNLTNLFEEKRKDIKKQIETLQFSLKNLNKLGSNLKENGTMIKPEIRVLKSFGVYYIERESSYVKIGKYCEEIISMFEKKGKNITTMAIFENPTYQPKKSKIKIVVLAKTDQKIKEKYKNVVKKIVFDPGKVITYTHNGDGKLLSLFWKELEKYCRLHKIEIRKDMPDFEIYRKVSDDPRKQFFEIYLPIK